ncbi:diacylglycerol kinase [Hoeflea sp. YIM 152468]|uniref:diacylglycerol kinase n=1 Tax=Hoeflea sp. YIM 152468 TaxID=3031759 RepID=UPI0023DA2B05|nr:diacylglycerol kinase [Hoeflea sp. YIM 152468]MDF1607201.1 diacylglycerol kinase [Hoeflea sp. YIM 152468]
MLAAARYSLGGAKRLWREAAFRHETLALALILGLFGLTGAPLWGHIGAVVLYLLTASIEALNTAVEEITDHASPEYSEMARHAKDLGSFAVSCLLLVNAIWAVFVLWSAFTPGVG